MSDVALATPDEAAQFLRTTRAQLSQDRYQGRGPRYVKLGRRVLYRWEDLRAYVDSNVYERTDMRAAV